MQALALLHVQRAPRQLTTRGLALEPNAAVLRYRDVNSNWPRSDEAKWLQAIVR